MMEPCANGETTHTPPTPHQTNKQDEKQKVNHPSTNHLIDIATRHGLTIRWHQGGPKGAWLPPSMISIRHGMDEAETISTLAHEMAHAHHGDPCGHNPTVEHRAWKRAAHWLVCPNRYRDAELVYGPDLLAGWG